MKIAKTAYHEAGSEVTSGMASLAGSKITSEALARLVSKAKRFVLVNPPIYDYRLDWPTWHQPVGLLQLGTYLSSLGKSVRLIDCLHLGRQKRLPRRKIGSEVIDERKFSKWHFGASFEQLEAQLKALLSDGWSPEIVFVTSLNSIWWESVKDTISVIRKVLPDARVILGGAYPTALPDHALSNSGSHNIVVGPVDFSAGLPSDYSLYKEAPSSAAILFYANPGLFSSKLPRPRAIKSVVKEIISKASLGVRELVFFDEAIDTKHRKALGRLLDGVAAANLDIGLVFPGNLSPKTITQDLARKMRRAKVRRIYLRCDMNISLTGLDYTTPLLEYGRCINALTKVGGLKSRDGSIAAMLVAGIPFEDLDVVSERLIRLAHIVGSVMLVPFQYVPGYHIDPLFERAVPQSSDLSPDQLNGKTFLLARANGKKLEDYLELIRLSALLNSKYRSKTFDFLSPGLAADMFRESLRSEGWDPFARSNAAMQPSAEGLIELPLLESQRVST